MSERPGQAAGEIASERPGQAAGEIASERPGQAAGEIAPERPGQAAGETETAAERAQTVGEIWKDGPVWTVRSAKPEMNEARKITATERTAQAEEVLQLPRHEELVWAGLERTARGSMAGLTPEGVERSGTAQAGLEGLYRQTVRGLRPAAPALSPEQTGRTARAQEPGSAASLAVDELDRAVRRDSRRYDGGMSIY